MRNFLLGQVCLFAMLGCSMKPEPSIFSDDRDFLIRPYIVKRVDSFLLRYQIDSRSERRKPLLRVICSKRNHDSGFYYLSAPTSFADFGEVVERPLSNDDFLDFAKNNRVFWLNPDNSTVRLKIMDVVADSINGM